MIFMLEIDPPFRWRPEVQKIGVMTRIVWGWLAVAYISTGIRQMAQAFREDEREACIKDVRTTGGHFAVECESLIRARSNAPKLTWRGTGQND